MTTVDLDAIEARLAAATPGPWVWSNPEGDWGLYAHIETPDGETIMSVARDADADLIAHAPTDLAALVAEVDRLRARDVLTTAVVEAADSYTKAESDPGVLEVHRAKAYKRLCIALDALNAGGE